VPKPDGPDTKARILDAAERLFSEHGFSATSMRAIASGADVNLAAAHYHFGGKEAVLGAVIRRRLEPINRKRLAAVRRAVEAAGTGVPSIEAILEAFFDPAFETIERMGDAGTRFVRLVGRMHTDPDDDVRELFMAQFREIVPAFFDAFRRALPRQSEQVVGWKMHFVVGAMAHTLAWTREIGAKTVGGAVGESIDPRVLRDTLIAFCAGGLRAGVEVPMTEDGR
jgi:AcrR family transcriptional regulator